jgi:hypothetical protein
MLEGHPVLNFARLAKLEGRGANAVELWDEMKENDSVTVE